MKRSAGPSFVKSSTESKAVYSHVSSLDKSRSGTVMKRSPSPQPNNAPKPKGKRAMDAFLEEIKKEQAEREAKYARQAHGHGRSVTALA
ncbi:hypothetical protein E4T56_gene14859, partial [Termitomyces sp. T112]